MQPMVLEYAHLHLPEPNHPVLSVNIPAPWFAYGIYNVTSNKDKVYMKNKDISDMVHITLWCKVLNIYCTSIIFNPHMGLSENVVYPYTQWFCWSLSLWNGYFIGNIPNIFRHTHIFDLYRLLRSSRVFFLDRGKVRQAGPGPVPGFFTPRASCCHLHSMKLKRILGGSSHES